MIRVRRVQQAGGKNNYFCFLITDLFCLKLTFFSKKLSISILLVYTFTYGGHESSQIISLISIIGKKRFKYVLLKNRFTKCCSIYNYGFLQNRESSLQNWYIFD